MRTADVTLAAVYRRGNFHPAPCGKHLKTHRFTVTITGQFVFGEPITSFISVIGAKLNEGQQRGVPKVSYDGFWAFIAFIFLINNCFCTSDSNPFLPETCSLLMINLA
jgi:hypothetical protein